MKYFVLTPYQQNQFNRLFAHANPLDPHVTGELSGQERCPKCGLIYGSLTWLPPRKAKLSSGRLGDFMWGAGVGLALSERALTAFCKGGVTGLERLDPPIEIVPSRRKSEPTAAQPVYHVVSYSRNGANLDDLASQAVRSPRLCSFCRSGIDKIQRVALEPGSWSGADIFVARGLPGTILVTEKLKRIIEEEKLTNVELIPAEEYWIDWDLRLEAFDRFTEQDGLGFD